MFVIGFYFDVNDELQRDVLKVIVKQMIYQNKRHLRCNLWNYVQTPSICFHSQHVKTKLRGIRSSCFLRGFNLYFWTYICLLWHLLKVTSHLIHFVLTWSSSILRYCLVDGVQMDVIKDNIIIEYSKKPTFFCNYSMKKIRKRSQIRCQQHQRKPHFCSFFLQLTNL